jgi:hypothetical protein
LTFWIIQEAGGSAPTLADAVIVAPFISHGASKRSVAVTARDNKVVAPRSSDLWMIRLVPHRKGG